MSGGEKYIFTAASCLSKEHEVSVFWDDPEIINKASEKFNLELKKVLTVRNIFQPSYPFIKRLKESSGYDRIIYLSDGSIPYVLSKLIIHFQSPMEHVNTNSFVFLFKKSRILKVVCNSYYTKKYIDRKFGIESNVLYPPADVRNTRKTQKEKIILTVGRFNRLSNGTDFKKLSFLVESFKKFQKKRLKGWKMNIVTSVRKEEDDEFLKFEKSIKSGHINVYKNAKYETLESLYDSSMIYWHAAGFGENLDKRPEWAEHFGMSTVEAMAHGAVPVVINAGGQPEIVNSNNGLLWTSQEELINLTHKLAVDKELFLRLQEQAIDTSKNFSRERFCEELSHLIW